MAYPVAVIQTLIEPGEVEHNRIAIVGAVADAVAQGSRLILLPEACITDIYKGAEKLAECIPGPSTEQIVSAICASEATVALPLLEKSSDGSVYSSCVLLTHEGIKGVARKTHLFRDETGHDSFRDADVMQAGGELSVFDLGDARVGVLLGFDAEFPEVFRTLTLRGADLILVALNTATPDHAFLASMALRNRVPVLAANRIGFRRIYPAQPEFSASAVSLLQDKSGTFLKRCRGSSAIFDYSGKPIAQTTDQSEPAAAGDSAPAQKPIAHFEDEQTLYASFRIDELRVQRLTSPLLAERRVDLYDKR